MPTKVRNPRRAARRKTDEFVNLQLRTVKDDLDACGDRVSQLERQVKILRDQYEWLHDKVRN